MSQIGKPDRKIRVEPMNEPVPPKVPDTVPAEPVKEPA